MNSKKGHGAIANSSAAEQIWYERYFWDGRAYVSLATGNYSLHERLRRREGQFYLEAWSNAPGTRVKIQAICNDCAASWMQRNAHTVPRDLVEQQAATPAGGSALQ